MIPYKPRVLSLCSGIGAIDLAALVAGMEIAGQVEINPFCRAVLLKNFGDIPRLSDLREITRYTSIENMPYKPEEVIREELYHAFGTVDAVVGGIPCQPFSSAGKQGGRNDDRYLWPETFCIIKATHPTWVVIENVDDFTYMALDDVSADLETAGYAVQAFVFPAHAVGAPHLRERCFTVAYSEGERRSTWRTQSEGQFWQLWPAGIGTPSLADAGGPGQRERTHQPQRERGSVGPTDPGIHGTQGVMADPDRQGLAVGQRIPGDAGPQYQAAERVYDGHAGGAFATQSRLGRAAHGLADWLDRHIWPALPGYAQHPQEPPRTVVGYRHWRRQRIEALGNAVVWQQIYPIFEIITQYYAAFDR